VKTAIRHNVKGGKRVSNTNLGGSVAVDRYLCSSAHFAPRFAEYVLAELVEPSVRAASPACGIDLVALARSQNVLINALGPSKLRLLTHLDVSRGDCVRAADILVGLLGG